MSDPLAARRIEELERLCRELERRLARLPDREAIPGTTRRRKARWVKFQLDSDLVSGTNEVTLLRYWDGTDPDTDEDGKIDVLVELAFEANAGALGYATLDDNDEYPVIQVECPGSETPP